MNGLKYLQKDMPFIIVQRQICVWMVIVGNFHNFVFLRFDKYNNILHIDK